MNDIDDRSELSELASLPREMEPSPQVEERVVRALKDRGLIAGQRRRPMAHWWQLAAAALIAAAIGWMGHGLVEPAERGPVAEREFLLLLSEPEALRTTKSEAELVQEYRSWAASLVGQNRLVGAGKLESGGRLLRGSVEGERPPTAGGALDSVTGYFLVRADSWEEALELAASCPHLDYGGEISVRLLEQIESAATASRPPQRPARGAVRTASRAHDSNS